VSAIYLAATTAKRVFASSKTVNAALNASVVVTVKELLNAVKTVRPVKLPTVSVVLHANAGANARELPNAVRIAKAINARALAASVDLNANAMEPAV